MKPTLLFLLLLFPAVCFSQSNFKKGYLISATNDSLPGFIDYKERNRNPTAVVFKTALNADSKTYTLGECKAYSIVGYESYERFPVNISMGEVNLSRLSHALDSSSRRDTVFLKVLQAGKNVTLYSYTDHIKTRFYLRYRDAAEPVELLLAMYLSPEGGAVQTYGKYISQLRSASIKYGNSDEKILARLKSVRYVKADLLQVTSTLNGRQFEKATMPVRFFLGAGLDVSKGTYSGETAFNTDRGQSKQSYSPMLTMGIDVFANPNVGKLIYRAELSFLMSSSENTATNVDPFTDYQKHTFDSYGVVLTPRVIYNFYNSNPLKIYAGAGLAMNYFNHKNNETTTQYNGSTRELKVEKDKVILHKLYFAPSLSAGVVLKRRIELFGNYYFTSAISDYTMYNVCMTRTDIGLRYLFGKL
jgi:hypothetical protein